MLQHDVVQLFLLHPEINVIVIQTVMFAAHRHHVPSCRIVFRIHLTGKEMGRVNGFTSADAAPFRKFLPDFLHFPVQLRLVFAYHSYFCTSKRRFSPQWCFSFFHGSYCFHVNTLSMLSGMFGKGCIPGCCQGTTKSHIQGIQVSPPCSSCLSLRIILTSSSK